MSERRTWAEIDTGAITHNCRQLKELAGYCELLAVVKAFGYGHGAVQAAQAALAGGATWLGVALVEEGEELRQAGITAPILLLSEPHPSDMAAVVSAHLSATIYTAQGLAAAASAVAASTAHGGHAHSLGVHIKVDTGMHRVGAAPADAVALGQAVENCPEVRLEGLYTHFSVADHPDQADYSDAQLASLNVVASILAAHDIRPDYLHAANSAALMAMPRARLDLVRCGLSIYGLAPTPAMAGLVDLRPALSLKTQVSLVKSLSAGEAVSYGRRWIAATDTVVATLPIGYADGVPRSYGVRGGEVLIGGRRCAVLGTVTMDQLMVDCGLGSHVKAGDEAVLIGHQGDDEISTWEWAGRVDTIANEVVCGISARVPRRWV